MNDAGTVFRGDVVGGAYEEGLAGNVHEGHQLFVFHVFQVLTLHFGNNRVFAFAENGVRSGLGQIVELAVLLGLDVVDLRADRQKFVGSQCPGGGGPGQEIGILFGRGLKGHRQGDNGDFLVTLRNFVGSEARSAARAIRKHLVTLVDHALLEELIQDPPDGFDVIVVQGDVRMIQVYQVAHAVAHLAPQALVGEDGFLALLVEFADAVFFDILLTGEAELLFHFDLYGQAVGVPSGFARYAVALHGLVAADGVLQRTGDHVVDARLAVCGRRSFVEDKVRLAFSCGDAFFQQFFLVPFVGLGKLHLCDGCVRQVFVHRFSSIVIWNKKLTR